MFDVNIFIREKYIRRDFDIVNIDYLFFGFKWIVLGISVGGIDWNVLRVFFYLLFNCIFGVFWDGKYSWDSFYFFFK